MSMSFTSESEGTHESLHLEKQNNSRTKFMSRINTLQAISNPRRIDFQKIIRPALDPLFAFAVLLQALSSCTKTTETTTVKSSLNPSAVEQQITRGLQGHFLNHRQAFSSDDQWLAFDGRTEDPKMGENDLIGMIHLQTGEVKELYRVPNQMPFGPGSGAVSFSPSRKELVFIRGFLNASAEQPYHFTRRSAIGINLENPDALVVENLDGRDITAPFTPGALRGGSHAYGYTADGNWLSYTYNDEILEKTAKVNPEVKDIRTVAFMVRGKSVAVQVETPGTEFSGANYSVIAAEVVPFPKPGSDEIQKAAEEAWVGKEGFTRANGEKVYRALAYLGDVMTAGGKVVTEVFVTEIPENWEQSLAETDLTGSETKMPEMPKAFKQKRLTHTDDQKYSGVQGPRHWLRTSQSGDRIFFYAKSDDGIVQLFSISPEGGDRVQVTHNDFSPDTSFSLSPDDRWIVFGFQNQLFLTEVESGKTTAVGPAPQANQSDVCNFNWSYSGQTLVYNKKVREEGGAFFQVFLLNPFE